MYPNLSNLMRKNLLKMQFILNNHCTHLKLIEKRKQFFKFHVIDIPNNTSIWYTVCWIFLQVNDNSIWFCNGWVKELLTKLIHNVHYILSKNNYKLGIENYCDISSWNLHKEYGEYKSSIKIGLSMFTSYFIDNIFPLKNSYSK